MFGETIDGKESEALYWIHTSSLCMSLASPDASSTTWGDLRLRMQDASNDPEIKNIRGTRHGQARLREIVTALDPFLRNEHRHSPEETLPPEAQEVLQKLRALLHPPPQPQAASLLSREGLRERGRRMLQMAGLL